MAKGVNKRILSERDICTKFITPALRKSGWDEMLQIREELSFTKGRIIVRGKLVDKKSIPVETIADNSIVNRLGVAASSRSCTAGIRA